MDTLNTATPETVDNSIPVETNNKVVITLYGNDYFYDYDFLGITFNTPDKEILSAVDSIIRELCISLGKDSDEYTYVVRKAENTRTAHVYPYSNVA